MSAPCIIGIREQGALALAALRSRMSPIRALSLPEIPKGFGPAPPVIKTGELGPDLLDPASEHCVDIPTAYRVCIRHELRPHAVFQRLSMTARGGADGAVPNPMAIATVCAATAIPFPPFRLWFQQFGDDRYSAEILHPAPGVMSRPPLL